MKLFKVLTLVFVAWIGSDNLYAQPRLYGLSPEGGDVFGTIYSTSINGGDLQLEYEFTGNAGAYPYFTKLCDASNGRLYGLTTLGGRFGNGVLFSFDTSTKAYKKLIDFNAQDLGSSPRGGLILANNGKLYGLCSQGGDNGFGTLFEFNLSTDSLKVLHNFDGDSTGKFPFSNLVQANNGRLYGLCYQGGLTNEGVLFEYDLLNDTLIKRIDFDGTNKGRNPYGSLLQASNGLLYGMSYQGGAYNFGTFFSYNPSNYSFDVKFDFDGFALGSNPYGTPVQHSNGSLYALTYLGGSSNFGTLIEYDPSVDTVYKHFDFTGGLSGRNPYSELTPYNGLMYGLAPFGGTANAGIIFAFDPSNNSLNKQLDLPGTSNGVSSYGGLTLVGNNLYGCTYQGGSNASGVLFKFDPSQGSYTKQIDFNSARNGSRPFGGLYKASNGRFYGLTYEGGKSNAGVLFEFDPENGTYVVKAEFNASITGRNPYGSLVEGNDKTLYGFCFQGGAYDYGTVFRYDIDQDSLSLVESLDDYTTGRSPYGSLTLAPDGKLYGMVAFGGTDDFGVLIRCDTDTRSLTSLYEFKDSLGSIPFGSLCVYDSVTLFGCTYQGGQYDHGVLFSYNFKHQVYTPLHHFNGSSSGSFPQGKLVLDVYDSTLYGVTQSGGANFAGTLFSYQPSSGTFSKRKDLGAGFGSNSSGNLMINSQGVLIGTTRNQGTSGKGLVFTYNPVNDSLKSLSSFNGLNGQNPTGELIEFCKPSRVTLTMHSCYQLTSPSGKYLWTQSGDYADTLVTHTGCDSIMTIRLTIADSSVSHLNLSTCDSFNAPDGKVFKSSGNYRLNLKNFQGCDSFVYLDLKLLNTRFDTLVYTCDSFVNDDGTVFKSTGKYQWHRLNANGCDSLVQLDLIVLRTELDTVYKACRIFVAPDGVVYQSSGKYQAHLVNSKGCDSLIRFQLQIDTVNTSVLVNQEVLEAEMEGAAYRWLNCPDYSHLSGEVSKQFVAKKNGQYAVEIEKDNCKDTSNCMTVSHLSLDETTSMDLHVYPNPNTGSFELVSSGVDVVFKVQLIAMDGREMEIRVNDLNGIKYIEFNGATGIYYLKVDTTKGSYLYKVVKL